jgi:hypothetical protein
LKPHCAGGGSITLEPMVDNRKRGDILMRKANGVSRLIDVGIVSPTVHMPDAANWSKELSCELMENQKRNHYAGLLLEAGMGANPLMVEAAEENAFVPFIMDATGRLGREARRFLSGIEKTRKSEYTRKEFLNELSAVLTQVNARLRVSAVIRAEQMRGFVV